MTDVGNGQRRDAEQEAEIEHQQTAIDPVDHPERPVMADPERRDHREAEDEGEDRRAEREQRLEQARVRLAGRQFGKAHVEREERDRDREHRVREEDDALERRNVRVGPRPVQDVHGQKASRWPLGRTGPRRAALPFQA